VPVVHRPPARSLIAVAAVLAVLVVCAPAAASAGAARAGRNAAPRLASPAAISTAEAVAAAYWGTEACSGDVEIAWRARPRYVNAISSWANPRTAYGEPARNFDCRVEFNPRATWTWAKFCTVLVHEFGHLTGHRHSPDPHDVMAPLLADPLPACVAARRAPAA
jgi:hypothetical protein